MIAAMSTELFLDFIGIRLDSRKAEDLSFTLNLILPDIDEKFAVELSNATLTNIEGFIFDKPDLSITIDRSDLEVIMMGQKSFAASIEDGTAKTEGDTGLLAELGARLVDFELGFEVLPGTGGKTAEDDLNTYEVGDNSVLMRGE